MFLPEIVQIFVQDNEILEGNVRKILVLAALVPLFTQPLVAEELKLEGEGVINYRYPNDFKEHRRYIRNGEVTPEGNCKFITTMSAKPGQSIYTKELAYNPHTCESLMVEGERTGKAEKTSDVTIENTVMTEHAATSSAADWTVHARLRTWYDDPVYIDVNAVSSDIWWDPTENCASGNYFSSQPGYEWLAVTGWKKLSGTSKPDSSCAEVSLDTRASYRSGMFPTCAVQFRPVIIRYSRNRVIGKADKSADMEIETIKTGPEVLCTDMLEENHELTVERRELIVDGEIGCQGRGPALFINDLRLADGGFHASAFGNDYNGTPLFFDVNGTLTSNYITLDVAMYTDAAHTRHVRSDRCMGGWDGTTFYDGSCDLVQNTSAGCVPIWMKLTKDGDATPNAQSALPDNDTNTLMRQ